MGELSWGAGYAFFVRAVSLMTAFSTAVTTGTAAYSQATDPVPVPTYPVRIGTNFSVEQGSNPQINYCVIHGFRANSVSNEDGPLHLDVEQVFDDKGEPFLRGAGGLELKHTVFTNNDDREIGVRIELDGKSYDLPSGDVRVAVLTFLEFRFPVELLNKVAQASKMKIYTIDPETKASAPFATANISSGKEAFPVLVKCANGLPTFPHELGSRWTVDKKDSFCAASPGGSGRLHVLLAPRAGPKKEDLAVIEFTEVSYLAERATAIRNPTIKIGGTSFKPNFGVKELRNGYEYTYALPAQALDRFGPGVKFVLENDGRVQNEAENLVPEQVVSTLKKCAASLAPSGSKPAA
jgi:hypothetical protein